TSVSQIIKSGSQVAGWLTRCRHHRLEPGLTQSVPRTSVRLLPVNGHLKVRSFGQLKVRTLGCSVLLERHTSSPAAGLPHPERFAGGHDHDGVMEKPVDERDGGGLIGQEAAPLVEG